MNENIRRAKRALELYERVPDAWMLKTELENLIAACEQFGSALNYLLNAKAIEKTKL